MKKDKKSDIEKGCVQKISTEEKGKNSSKEEKKKMKE